jgi:hypothetical protein
MSKKSEASDKKSYVNERGRLIITLDWFTQEFSDMNLSEEGLRKMIRKSEKRGEIVKIPEGWALGPYCLSKGGSSRADTLVNGRPWE